MDKKEELEAISKLNEVITAQKRTLKDKNNKVTEDLKCPECNASMIHVPYSGVLICSKKGAKHYTMYIKALLVLGAKIVYNDDRNENN